MKLIALIFILSLSACNSTNRVTINETGEIKVIEVPAPILPHNIKGLTFDIVVLDAIGLFRKSEHYSIKFRESQLHYNVISSNKYITSAGSYSLNILEDKMTLNISDSRFPRGKIIFEFETDTTGRYTVISFVRTHNKILDAQYGTFEIKGE